MDVVWDVDYIRAILYRDVVLFYLILLATWIVGNLVFLRSRPPVRNLLVYAEVQSLHSDVLFAHV